LNILLKATGQDYQTPPGEDNHRGWLSATTKALLGGFVTCWLVSVPHYFHYIFPMQDDENTLAFQWN
jgi:hypothetical protein